MFEKEIQKMTFKCTEYEELNTKYTRWTKQIKWLKEKCKSKWKKKKKEIIPKICKIKKKRKKKEIIPINLRTLKNMRKKNNKQLKVTRKGNTGISTTEKELVATMKQLATKHSKDLKKNLLQKAEKGNVNIPAF